MEGGAWRMELQNRAWFTVRSTEKVLSLPGQMVLSFWQDVGIRKTESIKSELLRDSIRLLPGIQYVHSKDLSKSSCGYVCTCIFSLVIS